MRTAKNIFQFSGSNLGKEKRAKNRAMKEMVQLYYKGFHVTSANEVPSGWLIRFRPTGPKGLKKILLSEISIESIRVQLELV